MTSAGSSFDAMTASRLSIQVEGNGKSSVHFELNFTTEGFIVDIYA